MSKPSLISLHDQAGQIWQRLRQEANEVREREPALASHVHAVITSRDGLSDALGHLLAEELASSHMSALQLREVIDEAHKADPSIVSAAHNDLIAITERDPAATLLITPFLYFKGFHALQSYRVAHWLWQKKRTSLALFLQSRIAKQFSVDIHPAAVIGQSVMMDHANGIVIGETAVVEDHVSFLHSVTLGGTGKEGGDRHPKIRKGVMIGAGAKVLGNIEVGHCARIAAGSVVLEDVPPGVTVAGVPAKIVGKAGCEDPSSKMDQTLPLDNSK
ncbi:MAG: serine O-acetyltransferase [Alphaproteobacteria bacterium]